MILLGDDLDQEFANLATWNSFERLFQLTVYPSAHESWVTCGFVVVTQQHPLDPRLSRGKLARVVRFDTCS